MGSGNCSEVIDEEADRLNRGVEKLVELAKIEAGEMHVRRRWSDVEEIVAAALTQANRLTSAHTVEVRLEPEIPAVFVDAQAIAEVVYTSCGQRDEVRATGNVHQDYPDTSCRRHDSRLRLRMKGQA
jgi:hypothetical protein